ncbi:MAG: stage II sporulation protein P [Oscillospiraceae bacterium]
MKRRTSKKNQYPNELLIAIPLIAIAVFCSLKYFSSPITKLSALSLEIVHPAAAMQSFMNSNENEVAVPSKKPAPPEKVPETENKDDAILETGANKSLTKTPSDIINMKKDAESQMAQLAHSGVIVEKKYDAASSNASFKNVNMRNTTSNQSVNIEELLNKKASLVIEDKTKPTVLIFHTHTTESFEMADLGWYSDNYVTRSDKPDRNVVRVGDAICEELKKAGINAIHDTTIYDGTYTGAYDRSRAGILKILNENPSIKIVIDVHRDGIKQNDGTRIKPTTTVFNKKAAQVMIIAGCQSGLVKQFPTWEENLTFGLHLQEKVESLYSGTMRPILFCERKYNMDVTPCSLLLEFGSDSNTLEEVEYSGHLIGISLSKLIEDYI